MLIEQVRSAIKNGQSGSIFATANGRSCAYDQEFLKFLQSQAKVLTRFQIGSRDIEVNLDTGEVTPLTQIGWNVLESISESDSAYDLKVNRQSAAHANALFSGLIDVKHDRAEIRQEQLQTDQDRAFAGYGSSTMGGWVDL